MACPLMGSGHTWWLGGMSWSAHSMSAWPAPSPDHTCSPPDAVQTLLASQRERAAAFSDYENRVLVLELQSLVERYRLMDVEVRCPHWHQPSSSLSEGGALRSARSGRPLMAAGEDKGLCVVTASPPCCRSCQTRTMSCGVRSCGCSRKTWSCPGQWEDVWLHSQAGQP